MEGLLENLQIAGAKYVPVAQPYLHPGKSCAVEYEGRVIGWFGELHPTVAGNYGLNGSVCVLELDVEPLVASASHVPQFVHLPKYPATSRDIAVVVPLAFNLTFQADDRTLTDEEIDAVIKNVVEKVGEAYKAKLRD